MLTLNVCSSSGINYKEICNFARRIYEDRLSVNLSSFPEYFLYISDSDNIRGCFGLTSGSYRETLLVETYYDFDLLKFFSQDKKINRNEIAEIGTLAVDKGYGKYCILLIACMILFCYNLGIKFSVLTTSKLIQRYAAVLQVETIYVGKPDLKLKDEEFRREWRKYFKMGPSTIAFDVIQAAAGSKKMLKKFKQIQICDQII